MGQFKRREIYEFQCCNEGRLITKEQNDKKEIVCLNQDKCNTDGRFTHYFVILSPEDYCNSEKTIYISVLPITSSKKNYTVQALGVTLSPDDLESGNQFVGDNVLFDRPLRVLKRYMVQKGCQGMISYDSYKRILAKMTYNFGAIGILRDEFKKVVV